MGMRGAGQTERPGGRNALAPAGLLACAMLCTTPVTAAEPVGRSAIDACQYVTGAEDLAARLAAAGYRPITEADADAIFELSTSVALYTIAAGSAGRGDVAGVEAKAREMYASESDLRVKKGALAVRHAAESPKFIGPQGRSYVQVMVSTFPPGVGPAHTCEIALPEGASFAALHDNLPDAGPFQFPEGWIDQRADAGAMQNGGVSLSIRIEPDAFEALYGLPPKVRYQMTVNAAPPGPSGAAADVAAVMDLCFTAPADTPDPVAAFEALGWTPGGNVARAEEALTLASVYQSDRNSDEVTARMAEIYRESRAQGQSRAEAATLLTSPAGQVLAIESRHGHIACTLVAQPGTVFTLPAGPYDRRHDDGHAILRVHDVEPAASSVAGASATTFHVNQSIFDTARPGREDVGAFLTTSALTKN